VSSIERTAYPQLCEPVTPAELQRDFTPTEEEKLFAVNSARRASHRLGILVLLKVFLKLRRFLRPEEIPVSVANFIRARLGFSENVPMPYQERKLWFRHCQALRRYLEVKCYYGKAARHTAVRHLLGPLVTAAVARAARIALGVRDAACSLRYCSSRLDGMRVRA